MAVRNSHCRQSTNHIFAKYENQSFLLTIGAFQTKSILYSTRRKLLSGKIEIPVMPNPKKLSTIMITCSVGEPLIFEWI